MTSWNDGSIEHIIQQIKKSRNGDVNQAATLFIGAGCSISAGIPSANDILKECGVEYPIQYEMARKKSELENLTYQLLMSCLTEAEKHEIHQKYIENAKINWSHIAIIQLMMKGYVGRVITINFDDILIKAGALLGFVPAIYDISQIGGYNSFFMTKPAVFYIHGQSYGANKMYSNEQDQAYMPSIQKLFEDSMRNNPTLVIGYSGLSDSIFEMMENIEFARSYYWIQYGRSLLENDENGKNIEKDPPEIHLRSLLNKNGTFYLGNQNADQFLVNLCQELDIFPPEAIINPFEHAKSMLDRVVGDFPTTDSVHSDILFNTKNALKNASDNFANSELPFNYPMLLSAVLSEDLESLNFIANTANSLQNIPNEYKISIFQVFTSLANKNYEKIKNGVEENVDELYDKVYENYSRALEFKPKDHRTLVLWGIALKDHASRKSGGDADKLYSGAYEKFSQAVIAEPFDCRVFFLWSIALSEQLKTKTGYEADNIYIEVYDKIDRYLKIEPNDRRIISFSSSLIYRQIKARKSGDADILYKKIYNNYTRLIEIDPDDFEILYIWGAVIARVCPFKNTKIWPNLVNNRILTDIVYKIPILTLTSLNLTSKET